MKHFKKQLILFFTIWGLIGLFSGCNNSKLQCPVCHGTTTVSMQGNMVHCPICKDGKISQKQMDELTKLQPCAWCNGSGYTLFGVCPQCHGMGSSTILSITLSLLDTPRGESTSDQGSPSHNDRKECAICHGTGRCDYCAGRGWKLYDDGTPYDCSLCHGTGKCQTCYGSGKRY